MLSRMKNDDSVKIEEEKDTVGGSKFAVLESDVYEFTVDMAYAFDSPAGAMGVSLDLTSSEGQKFRTQIYMTSNSAKGGKNYYEKEVNGKKKKFYLPGYSRMNAMAMILTGEKIEDQDTETKTIKVYDFKEGKELPKDVDCLVDFLGEKILLGVTKKIKDKMAKDPTTTKYTVPTGEVREENEVDSVFRVEDQLTFLEIKKANGEEAEPVHMNDWLKAKQGKTQDLTKKDVSKPGAPPAARQSGAAAGTATLFKKKAPAE